MIVAFVTYGAEHATPSQQHWGDSNLGDIRQGVAGFAPRSAYVRSSTLWALTRRPRTGHGWRTGAPASATMTYWPARGANCSAQAMPSSRCLRCSCSTVSPRSRKPDLWFFPCHFKGDPVMPGCLGLDALWQLLGFFLGWLGAPGKGRALGLGELKFSGQVLPTVKNVVYGIDIKRVMRSKLVLGIADGWLSADGSIIYRAMDLKVGLFRDEVMQPSGG